MSTVTPVEILLDALRACDPEPYDGEHESLYYKNYAESLDAHLRVYGVTLRMNIPTDRSE